MRITLNQLIVTQNGLRNPKQIEKMVRFVKVGGSFSKDALLAQSILSSSTREMLPYVHIALMEDGKMLLHDGHHRAISLLIGDRPYFNPSEYVMMNYTYRDYAVAHPEKGWFTPFNVETEVRLPDFSKFKNRAISIYKLFGEDGLNSYISKHKSYYCELRKIYTVEELASLYMETQYAKT